MTPLKQIGIYITDYLCINNMSIFVIIEASVKLLYAVMRKIQITQLA